ncbi:hypothetical protein D1007_50738 [Hordeum vulgare]|nr:hypothetical protein D1007_50738 [Hordeum vulgare]
MADGGSLVAGHAGLVLLLDGAAAVVVTGNSPGSRMTAATTTLLHLMSPPDLMTPRAGRRRRWGSRRLRVGSGFPRARDPLDLRICYVGRIVLNTSGAVVNVTKWSSVVGSKGVMEVPWVRVRNVPVDKRSERNMAYVASLVGVPLEIDYATLHRPASARVKIGCRSVDDIPSVAEAVLGEHFYDFYFEVDQVLVVSVDAERGECDAGKVEYMVESPDNAVEVEVIPTPPLATEENLRFSLRIVQSKMEDVQLKAGVVVKKRNAEGTLHSHNSFDALSNQNMMLAASKMGVIIPDNDFVNIDIIRELEKFRNNNSRVEREDVVEAEEDFNNMSLINANGVVTPLELGWMKEGNMEEDDFTIVRCRKKNKIKKHVVIARPVTRSQKNDASLDKKVGAPNVIPNRGPRGRKILKVLYERGLLELYGGR